MKLLNTVSWLPPELVVDVGCRRPRELLIREFSMTPFVPVPPKAEVMRNPNVVDRPIASADIESRAVSVAVGGLPSIPVHRKVLHRHGGRGRAAVREARSPLPPGECWISIKNAIPRTGTAHSHAGKVHGLLGGEIKRARRKPKRFLPLASSPQRYN